jgi:hypothetical protein
MSVIADGTIRLDDGTIFRIGDHVTVYSAGNEMQLTITDIDHMNIIVRWDDAEYSCPHSRITATQWGRLGSYIVTRNILEGKFNGRVMSQVRVHGVNLDVFLYDLDSEVNRNGSWEHDYHTLFFPFDWERSEGGMRYYAFASPSGKQNGRDYWDSPETLWTEGYIWRANADDPAVCFRTIYEDVKHSKANLDEN